MGWTPFATWSTRVDGGFAVAELTERRWQGRPWLARGVRALVLLVPIAIAIACTSVVSRHLLAPMTTADSVAWWVLILGTSAAVLVGSDRLLRRLLPLTLLLKLSLPFPEAPPSRLRIAIRSGSPTRLQRWANSVTARGHDDPEAVTA